MTGLSLTLGALLLTLAPPAPGQPRLTILVADDVRDSADSLWISQSANGTSGYRTNVAVVFPSAGAGLASAAKAEDATNVVSPRANKARASPSRRFGRQEGDIRSPDGSRLAFATDRDGNSEVYTCRLDGSGLVNVSHNPAWDSNPVWSPTGDRIAYLSDRDQNQEIYVCKPDGTEMAMHGVYDEINLFADCEPFARAIEASGTILPSPAST